MNRKGFEPTMVLISLAIVLVVIFSLLYLFREKIGIFDKNVTSCEVKGGTCVKSTAECDQMVSQYDCPTENPVCCVRI